MDRLSVCLERIRIAVATSEYIITLIRHAARRDAVHRLDVAAHSCACIAAGLNCSRRVVAFGRTVATALEQT